MAKPSGLAALGVFGHAEAAHGNGVERVGGREPGQKIPACAVRQRNVREQHVAARGGEGLHRLLYRSRSQHGVAGLLQIELQVLARVVMVLHDQDTEWLFGHWLPLSSASASWIEK